MPTRKISGDMPKKSVTMIFKSNLESVKKEQLAANNPFSVAQIAFIDNRI